MSRRDPRDPFVVQTQKDGYTIHSFPVSSTSMNSRCGPGFYVMVPVLNEQAGYDLIDELKRRASNSGAEHE